MLTYLAQDILVLLTYLPAAVISAALIMGVYVVINHQLKKSVTIAHRIWLFAFLIYIILVLFQTFFSREPGSRVGIDLTFMGTWGRTIRCHCYVIENVLMMIPLGLIMPILWKPFKKFPWAVLTGFIFSVLIETFQLITQRGYCQLDDVIMNTLGTLIGYLVWVILFRKK